MSGVELALCQEPFVSVVEALWKRKRRRWLCFSCWMTLVIVTRSCDFIFPPIWKWDQPSFTSLPESVFTMAVGIGNRRKNDRSSLQDSCWFYAISLPRSEYDVHDCSRVPFMCLRNPNPRKSLTFTWTAFLPAPGAFDAAALLISRSMMIRIDYPSSNTQWLLVVVVILTLSHLRGRPNDPLPIQRLDLTLAFLARRLLENQTSDCTDKLISRIDSNTT